MHRHCFLRCRSFTKAAASTAVRRLDTCSARAQRLSKSAEGRLNVGAVGCAIQIIGQPVRVEVQHVRRNSEDFSQLVDHGILRRVAPIVLQIVEVRRQNLATVFAAKALGDLFLGQTCLRRA
jgi:hypothetical protein